MSGAGSPIEGNQLGFSDRSYFSQFILQEKKIKYCEKFIHGIMKRKAWLRDR